MKENTRAGFAIILLAGLFTFGLIRIFNIQFTTGEAYPPMSSLRSRPDGVKLLYDSLSRLPGISVSRNFFPLEYLDEKNATILLLNAELSLFAQPNSYIDTMEHLAQRGNRVVSSLECSAPPPVSPRQLDEKSAEAQLAKRWHIKLGFDKDDKHSHLCYFVQAADWRVLDRDGDKVLAVERSVDKGSIVLLAGSQDFLNRATVDLNRLSLISTVLGPNSRIIFDEQHLGVAQSGSIVGLAGRFRLGGMAIGLALCAALFIWKNAAGFPPPASVPRTESMSGRTSISGLFTLLRRHIPTEQLASLCWSEWLTGHRAETAPAKIVRAEAILREHTSQPLDAMREIQTVLHSKGPL